MKVRSGFVSNSSSSSFMIYGVSLYSGLKLDELVEKINDEKVSEAKGTWDVAEAIGEKLGISCEVGQDDECVYFGRYPESIGDDETGAQFKQSVKDKLVEYFGEDVKCDWHSEAWFNG